MVSVRLFKFMDVLFKLFSFFIHRGFPEFFPKRLKNKQGRFRFKDTLVQ